VSVHGLRDLRVLDLSSGVAGAYATKLLADAGAEVVRVEPPEGDRLRANQRLFDYLHTSKRSVRSSVPDEELATLVAGADVLVESGTVDVEGLRAAHPALVVVSLTPWGRTGPWSDRPATHFTVEAASGSLLYRGLPSEVPYQAGGHIGHWTMGSYAGTASLAAALHARRTGEGVHVDCSLLEVMAIANSTFSDIMNSMQGRPALTNPPRNLESPSIERCKDGWVGFNTNSGQMFQGFLMLIERFDLLDSLDWASLQYRMDHFDEWSEMMDSWLREHTVAETLERAAEYRVAAAPVHDGESILADEHLSARGVFVPNPSGFLQPRPPYLIDGEHVRPFEPAPALGEAEGELSWSARPVPSSASAADGLPLAGVRVLDVTSWWAGPSATGFLAALGAEVIHVESTAHPDGMRATGFMFGKEDWWEWGHMFVAANVNKLDLTLDLGSPRGMELLLELVPKCDLVVENFAPRVAERWGLTWDVVHGLNPRAVMMRMPAFGLSGPWRERPGFAQTMEQMCGLAWVTGPLGGPPRIVRGPCDPIAGMHGAFAALLALEEARRTGEGRFVEATMIEGAVNCAAEVLFGDHPIRMGNRSPESAPQGLYPCAGTEQWVALSVASDEQWQALRTALGWEDDPGLSTLAGRHERHDELDERLAAWAAGLSPEEAAEQLRAAGVPAVAAWDPRIVSRHPQVEARRLFEQVAHAAVGEHPVPGLPFRWSGIDRWNRTPTPLLGEHNHQVLSGVLGLSDDEIAELAASGVIGTRVG
jgi:crotonobetainyl-CoA:carnitine CoA-transferase CaiB-like acyl-CoA transferase